MDDIRNSFGSVGIRDGDFLYHLWVYPFAVGHRSRCTLDQAHSRATPRVETEASEPTNRRVSFVGATGASAVTAGCVN